MSTACGQESCLRKDGLGPGGHRETGLRHWAGHTVAPVSHTEAAALLELCGVAQPWGHLRFYESGQMFGSRRTHILRSGHSLWASLWSGCLATAPTAPSCTSNTSSADPRAGPLPLWPQGPTSCAAGPSGNGGYPSLPRGTSWKADKGMKCGVRDLKMRKLWEWRDTEDFCLSGSASDPDEEVEGFLLESHCECTWKSSEINLGVGSR